MKKSVISTGGNGTEILISGKDQEKINKRREFEEAKREQELQENYDEYEQYMKMINSVMGDDPGSGPHGSNMMAKYKSEVPTESND